jgi:curved DNA-binding protein CbpA
MKTLYDLLGARPGDDAEGLRTAFRKAAKASRSGLHASRPDAPKRFRQIVEAYDILRDAEHRAVYDRLLKFDGGRLSSKLKRAVSYLVHHIVSDAIGVVGLVIVLAGGHTLFAYTSKTSVNASGLTARGSAEVASIRPPVETGVTGPVEPRDKRERVTVSDTPTMTPGADALAANRGNAPEAAKGGTASNSAGPSIDVAKADNAFAPFVDQDQERKDNDVPQAPSPDFASLSDSAKSDGKHDFETPETRNVNVRDMKIPETKKSGKTRVEAKQQAKNRAPVKQASLEDRQALLQDRKPSACSGHSACSGEPPVFGVGF